MVSTDPVTRRRRPRALRRDRRRSPARWREGRRAGEALQDWKNVDGGTGKRIEELVRAGNGQPNPGTETTQGKAEANS
jgi:hypothetical protein